MTKTVIVRPNGTSISHQVSFGSSSRVRTVDGLLYLKIPLCSKHVTFSVRKEFLPHFLISLS